MPPEIYWIKSAGRGRLAVMPRPRGGDWLEDEILHLKRSGIGLLVSMLTPEEETLLGLGEEGALARGEQAAVRDDGVGADTDAALAGIGLVAPSNSGRQRVHPRDCFFA